MILSDVDIRRAIEEGRLIIDPEPPADSLSPSALDLHVGWEFRRWRATPPGADVTINLSQARIPAYGDFAEDVRPDQDGL